MFACCSGKIVIQQSEIDGGRVPPRPVLQPQKSGKFWRGGGCLPCRSAVELQFLEGGLSSVTKVL